MRVGTSIIHICAPKSQEDHPHACGDKRNIILPLRTGIGSSPCVWGQVTVCHDDVVHCRIIPMRVGTSLVYWRCFFCSGDHPHACGDKCSKSAAQILQLGSSPCVWGQASAVTPSVKILGSSPCVWGQDTVCSSTLNTARIIPMRVGTRSEEQQADILI